MHLNKLANETEDSEVLHDLLAKYIFENPDAEPESFKLRPEIEELQSTNIVLLMNLYKRYGNYQGIIALYNGVKDKELRHETSLREIYLYALDCKMQKQVFLADEEGLRETYFESMHMLKTLPVKTSKEMWLSIQMQSILPKSMYR